MDNKITKLKHITYRLEIIDDRLEFQVLEMDERFRASESNCGRCFVSQNGVLVISDSWPTLEELMDNKMVCLRGHYAMHDECTGEVKVKSPKQLKDWEKTTHEALLDWDENWEGWSK